MIPRTLGPVPEHGKFGGYTNHGCRCVPCQKANRVHQTEYRRTHRAELNAARRRMRANHRAIRERAG